MTGSSSQPGTIVDTREDSSGVLSTIYVKFADQNAGLVKMRSDRYASEKNIVPILRIEATFSVSLKSGPTIHRTQIPLMLAFAYTVHKVQGLTMLSVAVSFN